MKLFWIFDFGFWIRGEEGMKVKSSKRVSISFSGNPKSAIQNPKWLGDSPNVLAQADKVIR